MTDPTIDILLPTYNGERFIKEQMESVLSQTHRNWRMLIRDDGSSDGTRDILGQYARDYPEKFILVGEGQNRLGACQSFATLLNYSSADYVLFCDQDDVWFPDKIEVTLNRMLQLEQVHQKPILVHTDIKVVDENLKVLSDSFWRYQKVNPDRKGLSHLLIQNNVTGCAMMVNRRLKEICAPIPQEAIMYDWWIALAASAFGLIEYLKKPTMLYRQHAESDTGAKRYRVGYFLSRINRISESHMSIHRTIRQGRAFAETFKAKLSQEQLEVILSFSRLFRVGRLRRLRLLIKHDLRKYGALRDMGFLLLMLMSGGEDG